MYGTVMTESDKELARRIAKRFRVPVYWTEHDITELAAAFAALREECATECREDTAALRRDRDMLWGQVFERDKIIDGLRTAQPSGINVPGLGRLTESPEGEWTDEPR
jgi:hypothetical protein